MARRGENIRKRKDGRWEARYIKGRREDGRIKYGYVYSYKYSEVKKKQQEALRLLENGNYLTTAQPKPVQFSKFVISWREAAQYRIKSSSLCLYNTILERHLTPYFGKMFLDSISEEIISKFINQKISEKYSIAYIRSMVILLQSILKSAMQQQDISIPCIKIHIPAKKKCIPKCFSLNEWKILENHLLNRQEPFAFGILLCMYTGIRIGELSGLKWGDFDMETEQLCIRRTVYRIKNIDSANTIGVAKTILNIGPPKTSSSIRQIPLPSFLSKHVMERKQAPNFFILTGTEHCMEPRAIQKKYRTYLEECHIPYINFHSLRHSFATIGIQKGVDYKSLSEILGHSSVTTTLNIYVHSDIERKRQCMELLWS